MSQVEQQNFKTLNIIDNIEIREYPPAIYASVTIKNSNNNNMFGILAGYIFGGNENNQKIAYELVLSLQFFRSEEHTSELQSQD